MKKEIKGFIVGCIVTGILSMSMFTVFAEPISKNITAMYNNIKIYVDGNLIQPKDAAGNSIEPFIYNGTTYLPVRAIGEALGKTVQWDGKTNSVHIGKVVVQMSKQIQPYHTGGFTFMNTPFTMGGVKYYNGYSFRNEFKEQGTISFNLDGKYELIEGKIGIDDEYNNSNLYVEIYGDDTLLTSYNLERGQLPKDFSWDVKGVLKLSVKINCDNTFLLTSLDLGNVTIK